MAELRLAGARTLVEASAVLGEFLPRFNERFGVPAAEAGSAYRQPDDGLDVDGVLCVKETRRVAKDNTVQYHGRTLQRFPGADRPSYAGTHVEVQERLDGRLLVSYRGKLQTPQDAPPLAATLRAQASAIAVAPPPTWNELYSPTPVRKPRPRAPVVPGPLAGDSIWYEDPVRKGIHAELVRAGMERARQEGRRIQTNGNRAGGLPEAFRSGRRAPRGRKPIPAEGRQGVGHRLRHPEASHRCPPCSGAAGRDDPAVARGLPQGWTRSGKYHPSLRLWRIPAAHPIATEAKLSAQLGPARTQ